MERITESKAFPGRVQSSKHLPSAKISAPEVHMSRPRSRDSKEMEFSVRVWKGKHSLQDNEELMVDAVTSMGNSDIVKNGGLIHPPEPIERKKSEPGRLVKSFSKKGPFLDDLSIKEQSKKPNPSLHSHAKRLAEVENGASLPLDSEEEDYVWDASFPPSGNMSPLTSMDSTSVVRTMSIVNSCASTSRSDCLTSDGMLSFDRNLDSGKCSVRVDSIESAKTSMSRASEGSGLSDESSWSNLTGAANKPHKGNDPIWKAILAVRARAGDLGMTHFRLLKRLGCGDIGSVYLSELSGTRCYFAMKVMDKASLAARKKLTRSQTEREILQLLDHPFLPTLYTHFETDRFACLVMEYCPGGDLHSMRQKQPGRHFSEYAARFYAAEVLLALEYLHMLGVIYRDLKPENVLVREDGHIMLSDFDLSLRCTFSPTLIKSSFESSGPSNSSCAQPACIEPSSVCIQPSCFIPGFFPKKNKKKIRQPKPETGFHSAHLPELAAEPTQARSMSFVGTHEYLAPEIIKGEGHGSAVDWWTFGVFLHELLYGKTPFKGSGNRQTLFNVVGQQLRFPDSPSTSYASRDLIRSLLVKEPQNRLGVKRGATEIKQHPFFEGVNWALIRCSTPPEIPRPVEMESPVKLGGVSDQVGVVGDSKRMVDKEIKAGGELVEL
ncbi:hypothetical protein V2J09_009095 [Rumex salicifolius]